jgi:hypothetical protein
MVCGRRMEIFVFSMLHNGWLKDTMTYIQANEMHRFGQNIQSDVCRRIFGHWIVDLMNEDQNSLWLIQDLRMSYELKSASSEARNRWRFSFGFLNIMC